MQWGEMPLIFNHKPITMRNYWKINISRIEPSVTLRVKSDLTLGNTLDLLRLNGINVEGAKCHNYSHLLKGKANKTNNKLTHTIYKGKVTIH